MDHLLSIDRGLALELGERVGVGRVAEVFRWTNGEPGPKRVIKLFRTGVPRSSAERELLCANVAFETGLPTPRTFGDVITLDGRFGIVFELVSGPTLLLQVLSDVGNISKYCSALADLHFLMHQTKPIGLPSKKERLIQSIVDAPLLTVSEKDQLQRMVDGLPDSDCLCHGDFHPGNVIYRSSAEGGPVIIDWVDANLGHPLADVARTRILLEFGWRGADGSKFTAKFTAKWGAKLLYHFYARRYFALSGTRARDVEQWMSVVAAARLRENVEDEQEYLVQYVRGRLAKGV